MTDATTAPLTALVKLNAVDAILSRILGERKGLETELEDKRSALLAERREVEGRDAILEVKRQRYQREEKAIRDERVRLVDRRKGLESLRNYKLQQVAQREIEHASKQLDLRDESLLKMLDEIDALQAELSRLTSSYQDNKKAFAERDKEVREHFAALEERESERLHEREEFLAIIDQQHLIVYDRLRERYPADAIVHVTDLRQCSGCFMQLGPQVVVEISRAKKLIRCPGCGRILYLDRVE